LTRGTRVWRDEAADIRVVISRPAQKLIGTHNLDEFVSTLRMLMEPLGCHQAYVSKSGAAVEVHLIRRDGWEGRWRIPRTTIRRRCT